MSPGTVLGGRYRLDDLLTEHDGARFWRATDTVLARSVGIHVVTSSDPRAEAILDAARRSARVTDPHLLRVLDCDDVAGLTWVVNEWGSGVSLDVMIEQGPLPATRAAWIAREVAEAITAAHAVGMVHGRLNPENVMVTEAGAVKVIGFAVYAEFAGPRAPDPSYGPVSDREADVIDLAGILYTALTGYWPGVSPSAVPRAPRDGLRPLRPRQVRAGVPRTLDAICDRVLNKEAAQHVLPIETAFEIAAVLGDYVGDPAAAAPVDVEPAPPSVEPTPPDVEPVETPAPEPALPDVEPVETPAADPEPEPVADPDATMAAPPPLEDTMPRAFAGLRVTDLIDPEEWEAREPAPPPPPFDQPPDRPLFADTERRIPEGAAPPASPPGPWPFDDDAASAPPPVAEPRRTWRRPLVIGTVVVLLLAAMYVAFTVGRGDEKKPSASPSPTPTATPGTPLPTGTPLEIFRVTDFDPEGDPPRENPEQTGRATDGNPGTGWRTSRYVGDARLGGLKSGVGLLLDLGSEQDVGTVQLGLVGTPTSLEVFTSPPGVDDAPVELAETRRQGALTADGTSAVVRLEPGTRTRYLVIWLTRLPAVPGGFRGEITEIAVRP